MICPFCYKEFNESDALKACQTCSMFGVGGCRNIKCIYCGYEFPQEPRIVKCVKSYFKRNLDEKR
jgi:hypothetical protein